MNFSRARSRLTKIILFDCIKKLNFDNCYRCNKKIEDISDLSIEHKIPWLNSNDPIKLFFDLDNIAFSHLKCNSAASHEERKIPSKEGHLWCWNCQRYKLEKEFPNCAKSDRSKSCTYCASVYRQKYRTSTGKR